MQKLRKKRVALLTACVISALVSRGFAAEEMSQGGDDGITSFMLDDMVVTATRTPMLTKEVPSTVQIITAEEMQNLGATDLISGLRLANNISMPGGMAGNELMIRGMSTNHALVLVDGKRTAGEDTSATTNRYALARLSLSNVARVEIVRGVASALYGSDALGGVVNIITKNPEKSQFTAGVSTGTEQINNYYHYDSGKMGKFSAGVDARFTEIRERKTGGSTNYFGPERFFSIKGIYDFEENKHLQFDAGYLNVDTRLHSDDQYRTVMGMPLNTQKDYVEYNHWNRYDYSLSYSGETQKGGDYRLRAYYSHLKKDNENYNSRASFFPPMLENMLGGMYSKYDWDHIEYDMWGVEGKNTVHLDKHNTLTFGAEYRVSGAEGTRLGDGADNVHQVVRKGNNKFYSDKEIINYAAYIQDIYKVGNKLTLVPSVRYDHDNTFGGEISPKLGLTYEFSGFSRIKASAGRGFKAPTISEMYFAMHRSMGGATINIYGNPDLQPEKSKTYEISLEGEKKGNYGKATYFHNDVDNLITTENVPGGSQYDYEYVNVNKARIQGLELEAGRKFNKHWSGKVTYNYLDAIDKQEHTRLTNRARQNGTVQLSYTDGKKNPLTVTLWDQYFTDYKTGNGDYTFNTVNLAVNKQVNGNLRVYAALDNIFDKTFASDASVTDGRVWRIGAEMTF